MKGYEIKNLSRKGMIGLESGLNTSRDIRSPNRYFMYGTSFANGITTGHRPGLQNIVIVKTSMFILSWFLFVNPFFLMKGQNSDLSGKK